MKLTLNTFLSVDGVMQGPGSPDEDQADNFTAGGWMPPYADADSADIVDGWYREADAILLGRTTYEMMRDYWSTVSDPDDYVAAQLNGLPKYVASTSIKEGDWFNTSVIGEDVRTSVQHLKEQSGRELQIHGSWKLAQYLHKAGLIDEYRLLVLPVLVGSGKRLFPDDAPVSGLELLESRTTAAGAVYSRFTPSSVRSGAFVVSDGQRGVSA